ncbi:hypothetical protein LEP1GSC016_1992 [Leptospira borgpetersenii serovar Hardjo-bovis str. Sponselee]|uniref:Uncharacterized protein n=2 Tax=Leptospira borgpetersenii TaxID=174 RepID=M6BXN6_LEPBO|nr:hypothetical protein LEP1GSC016_1992 [Leptospira borgpetersenii serovar Hardjo-bovis str. Sponselee]EMO61209.1 hypothetical protein LEP1GSC133_0697 [Leptospira borgpetersenii serovar Pomona str. 200901868]
MWELICGLVIKCINKKSLVFWADFRSMDYKRWSAFIRFLSVELIKG